VQAISSLIILAVVAARAINIIGWWRQWEGDRQMADTRHVQVRRIYDVPAADDGKRLLVDRLWPRGISKERARLDEWCKGVAPSTELRQWYGHDPARFAEFDGRYRAELQEPDRAAAFNQIAELADQGPVTLLTASKAVEISEAQVLANILLGKESIP